MLYFLQALVVVARSARCIQLWRRLLILALCGMPALWADVCGGLPTGFAKWTAAGWPNPKDHLHPVSFRLSVKQGSPAFRITVGVALVHELESANWPIHAADIEVARCQDGKRLQLLPILSDQALDFGASFHAEDINFDGYLDFSVLTEFGARFGSRSYWVYDQASGLFVQNELTRRLGRLAVSNIDFDPTKNEVSTIGEACAMCACPDMTQDQGGDVDRYRVVNNRLILIHKQEFEFIYQKGVQFCVVTLSDLLNGTMRVTEVRRFDAHGKRVK